MIKFLKFYLPLALSAILIVVSVGYLQLRYTQTAVASSVGPIYPTGAADFGGVNCTWANQANIYAEDGSVATCILPGTSSNSDYIVGQGYGFSIPAGATINGIQEDTMAMKDTGCTNYAENIDVAILTKNGTGYYKYKLPSNTLTTSLTYYTSGSSSDLWGGTFTAGDINASTFGAGIKIVCNGQSGSTVSVDTIRITVTYTLAAGGTSPTPAFIQFGFNQVDKKLN